MDFDMTGVITEYNPFHNGHAWLISAAREQGATHIVTVMSGNFVQRGAPAILPKETRALAAIAGGADLVLELPLPYAMSTAQTFASGAVALLGALGCVGTLAFGSECGNSENLQRAADFLSDPILNGEIRKRLSSGITYAKARQEAVAAIADEETAQLLASPNNTLAIEYLAAIRRYQLPIKPFTILRKGTQHHSNEPIAPFASATYLRGITTEDNLYALEEFVPQEVFSLYETANERGILPCQEEAFYPMILAYLRRMPREEFASLPDIAEGIEDRFYHAVRQATTYPELLSLVKTKRYTLARIRRLVWSAFLGITAQDHRTPPPYLRILAMNERGREILSHAEPLLPLSSSLKELEAHGGSCARFAKLEARATDLYTLSLPNPQPCGLDYTLRIHPTSPPQG